MCKTPVFKIWTYKDSIFSISAPSPISLEPCGKCRQMTLTGVLKDPQNWGWRLYPCCFSWVIFSLFLDEIHIFFWPQAAGLGQAYGALIQETNKYNVKSKIDWMTKNGFQIAASFLFQELHSFHLKVQEVSAHPVLFIHAFLTIFR